MQRWMSIMLMGYWQNIHAIRYKMTMVDHFLKTVERIVTVVHKKFLKKTKVLK